MSLRVPLILAVAAWLVLGELDEQLHQLQTVGVGAGGMEDLWALAPGDLDRRVGELLASWRTTSLVAGATVWAYTIVDCLFVAVYVWLFWRLFEGLQAAVPDELESTPRRRAAERWRLLVVGLAIADVVENILRLLLYETEENGFAYVAWGVTWVKWALLALILLLLLALARDAMRSPAVASRLRAYRWAAWQLRVPVVLIGAWSALLLFDPGGQVSDLLRRWLDGFERLLPAAVTVIAAALLGLAAWSVARRLVLSSYGRSDERPGPLRLAAILAGFGALAALTGWDNLAAPATVCGLLLLLELLPLLVRASRQEREDWEEEAVTARAQVAGRPPAARRDAVRGLARCLAVVPLVTLALATCAALAVPPIVLLAGPAESGGRATLAIGLTFGSVALAVTLASLVPAGLARLDATPPGAGPEARHLAIVVVALVACAVAVIWPLDVPGWAGAIAVAGFALTALTVLLAEAQRFGDVHAPTRGLAALGFKRLPVTLLLVVAFLVASVGFNDDDYHAVSRNASDAPAREGMTLVQAFDGWKRRNCVGRLPAARRVPLVLVASYGGGRRAAYWTSAVMTELFGMPPGKVAGAGCSRATTVGRVFAASGASGGSLGLVSYVSRLDRGDGERWYEEPLGRADYLGAPTAGLFVDLARTLIGFEGPDRARRLEQAWEDANPELATDYFAGQGSRLPLLMLNGTLVENGCRLSVSVMRLTRQAGPDDPSGCAGLKDDRSRIPADDGGSAEGPSAQLTSDALDYLCDGKGSLDRSAAALLSARFPYISPSGRLSPCDGDGSTAVVDGGYAENSGAQPLLHLWDRLAPLVERHNDDAQNAVVVPVFLQIDNHYTRLAKSAPVGRTGELLVPPLTALRPDKLDDRGVEQRARSVFTIGVGGRRASSCTLGVDGARPYARIAPKDSAGLPAPLAWTLSRMATDDLDDQLRRAVDAGDPENKAIVGFTEVLRGDAEITCALGG